MPRIRMQELAQLLSRTERSLTQRVAGVLDGFSVEQWRTLVLLSDGAGHPMSEIAEFAVLPAASSTRLVDRMVSENLVYRKVDPADRRRILVHVTPRGAALRRRLAERVARLQDTLLAEAGADDVEALVLLLSRVLEWSNRPALEPAGPLPAAESAAP